VTGNHYVSRTLAVLRAAGWIYDRVEQVVPRTHTKRDLFGGIDYLALRTDGACFGLQITSGSNHAARVAKLSKEPRLVRRDDVVRSYWTHRHELVVVSWSLRPRGGKRGARKVWTPRASIMRRTAATCSVLWDDASMDPADLFRVLSMSDPMVVPLR
jgi:hypothetical protein